MRVLCHRLWTDDQQPGDFVGELVFSHGGWISCGLQETYWYVPESAMSWFTIVVPHARRCRSRDFIL